VTCNPVICRDLHRGGGYFAGVSPNRRGVARHRRRFLTFSSINLLVAVIADRVT